MLNIKLVLARHVLAFFCLAFGISMTTLGDQKTNGQSSSVNSNVPKLTTTKSFKAYDHSNEGVVNLTKYTAVVVFGASDCDDAHPRSSKYNNTLRGPPYWKGRFTNGPVFVEYLAQGILSGKNINLLDYAYGGATISNNLVEVAVPDTGDQTHNYLRDVEQNLVKTVGRDGSDRVLHIFWIGTNDVIQIWQDVITNGTFNALEPLANTPDIAGRPEKQFKIARDRIDLGVTILMKQVASIRDNMRVNENPSDILILTLPPLETFPNLYYHSRELVVNHTSIHVDKESLAKTYQRYIGELVARFNQGIINSSKPSRKNLYKRGWKTFGPRSVQKPSFVKVFDTVGFWKYVHSNPSQFGFENVVDACWNSSTGGICSHPDRWEYWDTLHATTTMYKHLAHAITVACNN
ncbi:hypothetical protein CROQUDRAFT_721365 [Cronartium quercuum f. sp. fusiforme G11]|uniref:Uncharacterized protein n=1 Tax=Cronartium quercuum f. sp. fusiforme G11 TaxID=708437 RepID=A0A9P6NL78_9BASI|nr:hypothetical protein CROQUDRAFT_721365 [Cronartium quercuum f. sp. fusiforme G11]